MFVHKSLRPIPLLLVSALAGCGNSVEPPPPITPDALAEQAREQAEVEQQEKAEAARMKAESSQK